MPDEKDKKEEESMPQPRWDVMTECYEGMNKVFIESVEKNNLSIFERKVIIMMLDNIVELDKTHSMIGYLQYLATQQTHDADHGPIGIKGKDDIYK